MNNKTQKAGERPPFEITPLNQYETVKKLDSKRQKKGIITLRTKKSAPENTVYTINPKGVNLKTKDL